MSVRTSLVVALAVTATLGSVAACDSGADSTSKAAAVTPTGDQVIHVAQHGGPTTSPIDITVSPQAKIRAELPAAFRDKGVLTIGVGALPAGFPPLAYVGDDQKSLTGSEPDLGRLLAAVLGLQADVQNASWENLFVRLDSGQFDVGTSNITVTEERKDKYDFASYRQDNLGLEVLTSSSLNFTGDYHALAGKTVAVGSGTNQEKILLEWAAQLKKQGSSLTVKYFNDTNAQLLALQSGRIDAYFGPNPGIAYQVAQNAKGQHPLRAAGTYSGAGASLQGLIAAATKKGNGLAKPLADAINYLISSGKYAQWLAAYHLSNEAVPNALVNPAGLPRSNS